jgi:hypothetical protein
VLALTVGQDAHLAAVGRAAHDLEPAVGIGHVQQRAVGHPDRTGVVAVAAGHDVQRTTADIHHGDLMGVQRIGQERTVDRQARTIGCPGHALDVVAGRRDRAGHGHARFAGRASPPGHGRLDDPDLGPASAPRQEGQSQPVG